MNNSKIFIFYFFILLSCSTKKNETVSKLQPNSIPPILYNEDINIINDFLDIELKTDRYEAYKNIEIILIKEAGNGIESLFVYDYAYKDWHSHGNNATIADNDRLGWILDSLQIKDLKRIYNDKQDIEWRSSDIKNYKVTVMKNETLREIIKSGNNFILPEKLILYISKPLIIDNNNALISFSISNSRYGNVINRYTVLMKAKNKKWVIGPKYWDGRID